MPSLPKRPCSYPGGCAALVDTGRCPAHQQAASLQRGKTAARGYGADHRRIRIQCFERDEWRCVDCGWEPESVRVSREARIELPSSAIILEELRLAYARSSRHLHADHEIPIDQQPELRLVLDNLRTRCDRCHNAKTAREDGGFGRAGAVSTSQGGKLIVLMGAPGSGKSTYARGFGRVVTTDVLRVAVAPSAARIAEVFDSAFAEIREHLAQGSEVVFDTTAANPVIRSRALRLARACCSRAELVVLSTPLGECIRRQALRDTPVPEDVVRKIHQSIVEQAERLGAEGWDAVEYARV